MSFDNGLNVLNNLKDKTVEELKAISAADRLPFAVGLMNIQYDLNIGNIIRTAHCMGAERVFVFGNAKMDSRACVGSQNYIEIIKVKTENDDSLLQKFAEAMIQYEYYPWMIDKTPISIGFDIVGEYYIQGQRPCLIFGNENGGIPEDILNISRNHYHIDQLGVIRSLNVSSAAAIVLHKMKNVIENYDGRY